MQYKTDLVHITLSHVALCAYLYLKLCCSFILLLAYCNMSPILQSKYHLNLIQMLSHIAIA